MTREPAATRPASGAPIAEEVTQIAIAVVERNDTFLVGVRAAGTDLAGKHEFPGGKVRASETLAAAAARECEEETGLQVEIVGSYPSHQEVYDHGALALHFFAARLIEVNRSNEVEPPWRWVPRAELSSLDFPKGNRPLLKLLLAEPPLGAT